MIFKGTLIQMYRTVKGNRKNHHGFFLGIAFNGFAIGIIVPKQNSEEQNLEDSDRIQRLIEKATEEERLKRRRN